MKLTLKILLSSLFCISFNAFACYPDAGEVVICRGDRVVDKDNATGTVVEVYSNGKFGSTLVEAMVLGTENIMN